MPDLDHKALEEACRAVAANTMWNHDEPRDLADIITTEEIEKVVAEYMKIAVGIADCVQEVDGDPNLVTRTIDYMAHQHAICERGIDDKPGIDQLIEHPLAKGWVFDIHFAALRLYAVSLGIEFLQIGPQTDHGVTDSGYRRRRPAASEVGIDAPERKWYCDECQDYLGYPGLSVCAYGF